MDKGFPADGGYGSGIFIGRMCSEDKDKMTRHMNKGTPVNAYRTTGLLLSFSAWGFFLSMQHPFSMAMLSKRHMAVSFSIYSARKTLTSSAVQDMSRYEGQI